MHSAFLFHNLWWSSTLGLYQIFNQWLLCGLLESINCLLMTHLILFCLPIATSPHAMFVNFITQVVVFLEFIPFSLIMFHPSSKLLDIMILRSSQIAHPIAFAGMFSVFNIVVKRISPTLALDMSLIVWSEPNLSLPPPRFHLPFESLPP